jgi:hypothetical protein
MNYYVEDGYVEEGYVQTGISIDFEKKLIFVPKYETELVQTDPVEIRKLDLEYFRKSVISIFDDMEGMPYIDAIVHYPEVVFGTVTLAPVILVVNDYVVEFEDGKYAVELYGANTNLQDRAIFNSVGIRTNNSAGLIDNRAETEYLKQYLRDFMDIEAGNWKIENKQMIFYRIDGSEMMRFDLYDKYGNPAEINVFERRRVV